MAYPTNSQSERPIEVCHYLFDDEDNTDLVSPFAPTVFYGSTLFKQNCNPSLNQDMHNAVVSEPSSTFQEIKTERKDEKRPLSTYNIRPLEPIQSFHASNDNKSSSLEIQDDKILTLNNLHAGNTSSDFDLLNLDDLFIAFITGESQSMMEDVYGQKSDFPDSSTPQLDEFFIIDKNPRTVNDLIYHSSKDNLVDLQNDIVASSFYVNYLEQSHSAMTSNTQIDEIEDNDETIWDWIDFMANEGDNEKVKCMWFKIKDFWVGVTYINKQKDKSDLPPNDDIGQEDCMESASSFVKLLNQE